MAGSLLPPFPSDYFFFALGKKTWRPRYIPQLGQAWCASRGLRHCGQATSCGRPRWWCERRFPWRACETRCFGSAPI